MDHLNTRHAMQSHFFLSLITALTYLSLAHAYHIDSLSAQGVNVITGEPEGVDESHHIYERYQEGWNQLGDQTLFLIDGDFRIGRVKTTRSTTEESNSSYTHFSYSEGETQVYDNQGRMSVYRYDHRPLIQTAAHYHIHSLGDATLCCSERHMWQEIESNPHLVGWVLEDNKGETVLDCEFLYNRQGELIQTTLSGNERDNHIDIIHTQGLTDVDASLTSTEASREADIIAHHPHDAKLSFYVPPFREVWSTLLGAVYSGWDYLSLSLAPTHEDWNHELQIPHLVNTALATVTKTLLGESTYLLMGPHIEETRIGYCGQHEISDKVRLTFINGILTTEHEMLDSLNVLSSSHGGTKVHYVFRPTTGWTGDISNAILTKTGFLLAGFRSLHAHLLAQMWRQLIQEMGGVEGGGIIIHYTHSLGGTDTDRARGLLTPEEQKMIRVTSFGSATLMSNTGFQSVQNIVSIRDGVSCFDPVEYLRGCLSSHHNVYFQQSLISSPWPIDHLLNGPTYRSILNELGEKFLSEFSVQSSAA